MEFLAGDNLGLFVLFVLPGVIGLKVYSVLVPSEDPQRTENRGYVPDPPSVRPKPPQGGTAVVNSPTAKSTSSA
jgi:hypothetical protein